MKIGQMFAKPIDRDLKGVIKVGQDDDRNIQQELEEYVVTRELQEQQIKWACGFQVSLEMVNPTS